MYFDFGFDFLSLGLLFGIGFQVGWLRFRFALLESVDQHELMRHDIDNRRRVQVIEKLLGANFERFIERLIRSGRRDAPYSELHFRGIIEVVVKEVAELKGGRVEFRVEKAGIVHARIGKVSFGGQKLRENAWALLELLHKLKPSSAKGVYMKSITVSTTMGPGIKLDPNEVVSHLTVK